MVTFLERIVLPNIDGVQADSATMDFVFDQGEGTTLYTPATETLLVNFMNTGADGGNALSYYMSGQLSHLAHMATVESYEVAGHLDGSAHGSPISSTAFTLGSGPAGSDLPTQVAATISYHASFGVTLTEGPIGLVPTDARARKEGAPATHSGRPRPQSSLRGRVFIGPLNTHALANPGDGSLAPDFVAALVAGAKNLAASQWAVWSRKNASCAPIIGGWVDNYPTTIRRRRPKTTTKTVWTP
jgi:hypothetical protein